MPEKKLNQRDADINWCGNVMNEGFPCLSALRWADGINKWPGAVLAFNHPIGVQIVSLDFLWILKNVDIFFLIWKFGINWNHDLHDTLLYAKQNIKINDIPLSPFNYVMFCCF